MSLTPPTNVAADDYEAIEGAVMETARGRWFLLEFARRQRSAQADEMMAILRRLERASAPLEAKPLREPIRVWPRAEVMVEKAPPRPTPAPVFDAGVLTLSALDALPIGEKIVFFA